MIKHDEVIRAWLDGKEIEFRSSNTRPWIPFDGNGFTNPMTYPGMEWRVKPEARTIVIPSIIKLKNVTASFDEDKREILVKFEEEAL